MKKIVFVFSVFAALMMSACLPETRNEMLGIPENAILLSSERYAGHGDKTAVNGTDAYWVNGDKVYLNGSEYEVTVSGGKAYVSVDASDAMRSGELYGYYGAYGTPAWNPGTKYLIVGVPSEYTSSYDGGRQVIALPMAAYKPASVDNVDSIKFKHVTAAVNVQLMDSLGEDVYVDKVVVTAEKHQLCSPSGISLNLGDNDLGGNLVSTTTGNRSVTVNFPENACPVTNGSSNKVVQVPIRPIGDGDHLTIEVYCHGATKSYHYSYRPDTAVPALVRNELLTAKVKLKLAANGGHVEEVVAPTYRAVDMSSATYPFTAEDGDTLYGTYSSYNKLCIIPDGVTVTFRGLSLNSVTVKVEGNSKINLEGSNSVTAAYGRPAIYVTNGDSLIIQGSGSLSATGGGNSAGIGCGPSGNGYANCGNIIIEGGTITATGGTGAAGIGTGANADNTCGYITIKNTVVKVTATKGTGATASIGRGHASSTVGTVTVMGVVGEKTDNYTYPSAK